MVTPNKTIDCFGLLCPIPIFKTAQEINELEEGQVLEVLATDIAIKEDMKAWCQNTGHKLLEISEKDGEYRAYVRKV